MKISDFDFIMKTGAVYALKNGEKITLSAPAFKEDGKIYVPAKEVCGKCDGYVELSAITDKYTVYDEMGLILISASPEVTSLSSLERRVIAERCESFIFDFVPVKMSPDYAPATESELAGFKALGETIAALLEKHGTARPYIFASAETLGKLKEIYEKKPEGFESQIGNIEKLLKSADKVYAQYDLNEDGTGLKNPVVNPHEDGYDVGGRLSTPTYHGQNAFELAFAYYITGDKKYASLAYYILADVGKWEHWGPGHFLNAADAASRYALVYDWLRDAWQAMGFDTAPILSAIYANGVKDGYDSVIHDRCDHPSARQGTGWRFKCKRDNWNSVCNAGMLVASFVLLGDKDSPVVTDEMAAQAKTLIGGALSSIFQDGFVLRQYIPDGSYVESNSYWAYGTGNLFRIIGVLYSALGTDLRLHEGWGLDKTCYYAINSESAEYVGWNYHDGGLSPQDTSYFNLFATVSGDKMLYAIRETQLKRGKNVSVFDLLYDPAILGVSKEDIPSCDSLPLDYYMEGIDALTVRDGFERGSLYAGIMGGYNPSGGSHNQLDSGIFMYHNLGHMWFCDLGSDYYNIKGGYFGNYALYRRNAEGNNTLCLASLPYGQKLNTTGRIEKVRANGDVSFAVIDNGEVYGDDLVKTAKRGMLLTNDRKTVVIQDEVEFTSPQDAFWCAHFQSSKIKAEISEDGKSCILSHEDGSAVAVKLLCDDDVKFEITDCYTFLLSGTGTYEGEYNRAEYSRLVIRFKDASAINCAVSIEPATEESGYTSITKMNKW